MTHDSRFWSMYKAALKAQLPFAIISGIIFFVTLIVSFIAATSNQYDRNAIIEIQNFYQRYFWQGIYMDSGQNVLVMVFLLLLAFASAMHAYSFLHNKKTVDLYHSLPVTRAQLLRANALAGYTAVLTPFVAIYLLTMAIQLISAGRYFHFGFSYFAYSLFDWLCIFVYIAVVYLFVAVIAVNVGTVFDMFAVSGAVGFIPIIVYLICGWFWDSLTYGASFSPSENILFRLSPFTFMYERFILTISYPMQEFAPEYSYGRGYIELPDYPKTLILVLCGLAVAALLYVIAAVCYRRRKSEIAEQTQPSGVLQTIVKFAAAFIGAALFFAIFSESNRSMVTKIIATLLGSVIIGLIAELILSRGVRSIKKNMKWLAGAAAVYCVMLLVVSFDVFGYVQRVPALDSVESVKVVNYMGRFDNLSTWQDYSNEWRSSKLVTPESIALVRESHKLAVENKPPKGWNSSEYSWQGVGIEYTLKNGSTLKRSYDVLYNEAYTILADLEDKDDFIANRSVIFNMDKYGSQSDLVDYIELYGNVDSRTGNHKAFLDDYGPLMEAVKSDMLNQSLEDIQNPKSPALGFINVKYKDFNVNHNRYSYNTISPSEAVVITAEYKNTLAELARQGLLDKLDSKLDKVKRVGFIPVWYMGYNGPYSRVENLLPWPEYSFAVQATRERTVSTDEFTGVYYQDLEEAGYIITNNSSEIEAVAKAGMSQFTKSGKEAENNKNYALACFVFEDDSMVWKLVKISDLPASLSARVQTSINDLLDSRWDTGYDYIGEPMAAAVTEAEVYAEEGTAFAAIPDNSGVTITVEG